MGKDFNSDHHKVGNSAKPHKDQSKSSEKNGKDSRITDWEKEQEQKEISRIVKKMSNYSFPNTNDKGISGKTVMGAYVNIATDNMAKTLQFIFKKIGFNVNVNSLRPYVVLEKILDAYRKEQKWKKEHPGQKKPGPVNKNLLSPEENNKLRTLLFHHFSVLAPILGNIKNQEMAKMKHDIANNDDGQPMTDEKASEIIKKVKEVVRSADIDRCLSVLICLSKAVVKSRNIYSHYRAYNSIKNQEEMFGILAESAGCLTGALKASAIICQSNAGAKASQYEFITGEYHYKENKKERGNYYYRIKGKRNVIKANDKKEPREYDAISDFGIVYLVSLFLSKSDTESMLDQLEVFDRSPFKGKFSMEKAALASSMAVYRINIPKGQRLKMEDDNVQLSLDMLNELQKCPQELYDVMDQKGKDSFKREQTEPVRDAKTGEYVRETFVKSETGQKGQQKVRTHDGTGNIVYKGKGVYSLLVRKHDRFPYFALRFIDNRNLFPTIRFQIDLGYYRFAFYPKVRIDGSEETRILQKRINGFGKLVKTENARVKKWEDKFQVIEIKKPNETEKAEIARDEEGNIIEIEQFQKADSGTKPFVTDKRANYNIHNNRIGLFWEDKESSSSQQLEEKLEPIIPELKTKVNQNDAKKTRADMKLISPRASLSVHDLPALIFYEYLRKGMNEMSAEDIIKEKYEKYVEFFTGVDLGTIKSWKDVEQLGLEKKDIPKKFWPYLDGHAAGSQTEKIVANYMGKAITDGTNTCHFKGHIQERIEYLEREIKRYNDICLKMATTDNEYGTEDYKDFRPAVLARKMARSIMKWLPADCTGKKTITGVNYGVMTSVLSHFGSDGNDINAIKAMFINGGIIASDKEPADKSKFHPFLNDLLGVSIPNMENLYIMYVSRELEYVKSLCEELESAEDKRTFIQTKLPFSKLSRKRFDNRDEEYYHKLANRYLKIDNSENGGGENDHAIIQLPDGLFTKHIFNLLKKRYPGIFTGNAGEGDNNNASYLISSFLEKVIQDESQAFYQNFIGGKGKKDSRFNRHYKFFDYYDDPKLLEKNYPGNSKNKKKKKSPAYESKLLPKEINDKLKVINRESIRHKVQEYIKLEEAKQEAYRNEKAENRIRLKDTEKRPEKQWTVHSRSKNKDFVVKKDEEIARLTNKLKKLDQMILNSQQKVERIKETYDEKFISLKNECQRNEKTIRRYRIEDIVTFLMITTYFKEIFKDKSEGALLRLQQIGSEPFVEATPTSKAFLDKEVPFSRIIPITFTPNNENDMFEKNWERNEKIGKKTIDCEIFLNRIAIRNYNLAIAELNDERLLTFLSHYVYIRYQNKHKEKLNERIRINYNRLSLEFKMFNQLRPEIFREVHAIEKIIVDHNTTVLNNDQHRDFFIPMTEEKRAKIKPGEKIIRPDEDAKRNSFVNLLKIVFDEKNKASISANFIRNSAAHNHYKLLFNNLADDELLFKIMRAYEMPDRLPRELRHFEKKMDLDKKDPHSFAALILKKIKEIRDYLEVELKKTYDSKTN